MKIQLVIPTPKAVLDGNKITARRWARILRELNHQVAVQSEYDGNSCDLLIALHAVKSLQSIRKFRSENPEKPLVVALTGTDLYRDLKERKDARSALQAATRLVVLQRQALTEMPGHFRHKTRVIYQSARPLSTNPAPRRYFQVCVVGNLRPEKDPFRTALASRRLPASSRIRVVQVGHALSSQLRKEALRESRVNARYRWLGSQPHWKTRRLVARAHLVALTSWMEGSSNVLSEALVSSVPVAASRIPGLIGTLGEDYPGYFPVGDTEALAALLSRAETDRDFYQELKTCCARAALLVSPEQEQSAWQSLLQEL